MISLIAVGSSVLFCKLLYLVIQLNEFQVNIYKFLFGVLVTILLLVFFPKIFMELGWIPELIPEYWLILLLTGMGLLVKMFVSDSIDGNFQFQKFGYDNSIIAFGGVLTSLVLQFTSDFDYYPGLDLSPLKIINNFSEKVLLVRQIQLVIVFFIALIAILLTAKISRSYNDEKTKGKNFLAFLNSIIGSLALGLYVYILILKN